MLLIRLSESSDRRSSIMAATIWKWSDIVQYTESREWFFDALWMDEIPRFGLQEKESQGKPSQKRTCVHQKYFQSI